MPRPQLTRHTTESGLAMPSLRRALVLFWRAFRLRCPNCGRGRALAPWPSGGKWGRMREVCDACGLRFDRGDAEYYSSGSMLTNLLISELLFVLLFAIAVAATWPRVPWVPLTYTAGVAAALAPILFYPVSRVVWLALDLLVRPATGKDFADSGTRLAK